jgi:hypothetical protein
MSSSESFDEASFRRNVDEAMQSVVRIVATTKHAEYVGDTPHTYDDKFALVEASIDSFCEAVGTLWAPLGLDAAAVKTMRGWARNNKVTNRSVLSFSL